MVTAKNNSKNKIQTEDQQLEELLASIVDMIKQREQFALETSFGRTISRLTEAKTLTCYRLKSSNRDLFAVPILHFIDSEIASQHESALKAIPISGNPALAGQLAKTSVADMFQGKASREKNLILPLRGANGQVLGCCQIENARNDANIRQVLSLLLEFYQQFLTLLDDTERDNLTGLFNRKTLIPQVSKILQTLQNRYRRKSDKVEGSYCLAMFDIDHFKRVNDTFGHIYGDEVLLLIANLMRGSFRDNDQLFRYGGEEFVVILNNIDVGQAKIVLERFRAKVGNHKFPHVGQVTISVGVAVIHEKELPGESIHRADRALYYAKAHGRNQVHIYEELVAQGLLAE